MIWKGYNFEFTTKVIKHRYYVYLLRVDEITAPFYIGKGTNRRAANHHKQPGNSAIKKLISKNNDKYFIEILNTSDNEEAIYELERSYISKFGKKIDSTGPLLNFADGGRNTAKTYFKYAAHKEQIRKAKTEQTGKPIFVEGFIFPAFRFAAKIMGTDRNHLKYLLKLGKAFFLCEDNTYDIEKYNEYFKCEYDKYHASVSRSMNSKVNIGLLKRRKVMIDGRIYSSFTEAARETGVGRSAIGARIARGNQKNTYLVEESS